MTTTTNTDKEFASTLPISKVNPTPAQVLADFRTLTPAGQAQCFQSQLVSLSGPLPLMQLSLLPQLEVTKRRNWSERHVLVEDTVQLVLRGSLRGVRRMQLRLQTIGFFQVDDWCIPQPVPAGGEGEVMSLISKGICCRLEKR